MEKDIKIHEYDNIKDKMPSIDEAMHASEIFTLLSDTTRMRILWLLCHTEECVSHIALAVNMSAPAVSHHLRYLKQSKIIVSTKVGKETFYRLADTNYSNLIHKMIDDVFSIDCPHINHSDR